MDHSYIDQHQIAERYLQGRLSAAEAERFEEHSMACAECLDRLEVAERLERGLKQVAADETRRAVAAAVGAGLLARLARSRFAPLALTLLLVAFLVPTGVLWWQMGELQGELERARQAAVPEASEAAAPVDTAGEADAAAALRERLGELEEERRAEAERLGAAEAERARLAAALEAARQPQVNVPLLTLGPERSAADAGPAARVELGTGTAWVLLSLDVAAGAGSFPSYRVVLVGPSGRTLWQSEELRADGTGYLNLTLPTSLLEPGDHALRVSGLGADGEAVPVGSFPFRAGG